MFEKRFEKALKEKRSTMVCSTEIIYARKMYVLYMLLFFYSPIVANLVFWRKVPTIAL